MTKNNRNVSYENTIVSFVTILFISFIFSGCESLSPAVLSITREIFVPELDGAVYISAIQDAGKSVQLTQSQHVTVYDDTKKIAVLSIQVQNMTSRKAYDFSPVVLLDNDLRILPDHIKYFQGDSAFGFSGGVESRNILNNKLTMSGNGGKYTINLIYAVKNESNITRAEVYGQIIEFNSDQVLLNVIDKFNKD